MRPVCVICTDVLVINSHISACQCGHIFHEECLFRWIKTSKQTHCCPQCRAKVVESTIIKRLYLTEADLSSTQAAALNDFKIEDIEGSSSNSAANEIATRKYEQMLNLVEDLKRNLKEKSDSLNEKTKLVEKKDLKLKEYEESVSSSKKKLSENHMLIEYLKKELENFNKLKNQYDSREQKIFELDAKLREFKSIDLIYKDNESAFENEMQKYLNVSMSNLSNCQTLVKQLVSTNVLLKKELDKQTEDKKILRKKLFKMESMDKEKDKSLVKIQQDYDEMSLRIKQLEKELIKKSNEVSDMKTSLNQSKKDVELNEDSELEFLEEISKAETNRKMVKTNSKLKDLFVLSEEEESDKFSDHQTDSNGIIEIDDSLSIPAAQQSINTQSVPVDLELSYTSHNNKKRKNPFSKSDSFPDAFKQQDELRESKKTFQPASTKQFDLNLSRFVKNDTTDIIHPISGTSIKTLTKFKSNINLNSTKNSHVLNATTSTNNNSPVSIIKPLSMAATSYFAYQYDGLGGRKKMFIKSGESSGNGTKTLTTTSKSTSKLSKFKVT